MGAAVNGSCRTDGMRVLHIVAGLPPGGGLAESVPNLCRHLRQLGHEVTLATLDGLLSEAARAAEAAGVRLVRFAPSFPRALYFSWQMLRRLPALVRAADVVHVHSLWTFPVWWGCRCALRARKPLVMSPRGCLDPVRLRHSAWKKRLVGRIDRWCLRRAAVVHATSEMERGWGERFLRPPSGRKIEGKRGGGLQVVVPNGVSLRPLSGRKIEGKRGEGNRRMVLYLGRLHPLKGLEMLVEAWGRLHDAQHQSPQPSMEHWRLVIAGPDEQGTRAALERQSRELGHMESIDFAGPVYGEEKERLLDAADLFVLPSRSENFGIVVAEALAAGVPVITTKGAPWAELLGQDSCDDSVVVRERIKGAGVKGERVKKEVGGGRCGWWVEVGVEPLAEALREAMSLTDEERWAMGENGRRLVEKKYRWEAVAEQMMELYTHIQACTV